MQSARALWSDGFRIWTPECDLEVDGGIDEATAPPVVAAAGARGPTDRAAVVVNCRPVMRAPRVERPPRTHVPAVVGGLPLVAPEAQARMVEREARATS